MGAIQTSQRELEAFYSKALPGFLEYVRTHGTRVGDVELATDLEGITSLPALYLLGGVEKTVLAPLKLLTKDVDIQTEACKEAATKANAAAGNADAAAKKVTDAITDITAEKQAAQVAAEAANTAAGKATAAATACEGDTADCVKATADCRTATKACTDETANGKAANTAAAKAAEKADAAAERVNTALTDANAAASEARQQAAAARQAAEDASGKVSDMEAALARLEELEKTLTGKDRKQPEAMELEYPRKITRGNKGEHRIKAVLTPAGTGSNVLFLGDDRAVTVAPDGFLTVNGTGKSRIHVIPTENTGIYQTIEIEVVQPPLRLHTKSSLRLAADGTLRFN